MLGDLPPSRTVGTLDLARQCHTSKVEGYSARTQKTMNSTKTFFVKLPLAASLIALPFPISAEIIGYWPLDNNFDDTSGNANNGTFYGGTTYEADVPTALGSGTSVAFDGLAGTYGAINPDSGGLALTNRSAYSVSMWVKGDGTLNSDDRVFSEGRSDDTVPLFNIGTHNTSADGTVDFYIRNGGADQTLNHAHSTGTAFDNAWHHIVWTDNDGIIDLYIDGLLEGQYDYTNVPKFEANTTTIGGILRDVDCCNFLGSIDDVAMWDILLTPEEITSLSAGTASPTEVGLAPVDSDGDGLSDIWENANGLDASDDGSVNPDNGADGDPDMDDSINLQELENKTDPQDSDSDDDDLNDGAEALIGSNPNAADTDGDTLSDGAEQNGGTSPILADTDGDGVPDNIELDNGTSPTDIESPAIGGLLAAYWPLDGTVGTTTPDLSSNAYDLSLMSMDATNFVIDEGRAAASFNGVDTMLVRTHLSEDELPISRHPAFTISMWVKITGSGQNDRRFFSESSTIDTDPLFNLGSEKLGNDDSLDLYLRDRGTTDHQLSTSTPLDGTWRHIVYTQNAANQQIQVFVDGVLDRDDWTYRAITLPEVNITSIGGILRDTECCFIQGLVDDVSVWKGVMSPEKITQLASGTSPAQLAGLSQGLTITSLERDSAGNVTFTWNSRPGASYLIESSLTLEGIWDELDDSYASQGSETSYTQPAGGDFPDPATELKIFFRVTE